MHIVGYRYKRKGFHTDGKIKGRTEKAKATKFSAAKSKKCVRRMTTSTHFPNGASSNV